MRTEGFQQFPNIHGDDPEDTKLLLAMAAEARIYITSKKWCPPISSQYLAFGIGGIIAAFLFQFPEKIGGTDDALWVIVGDLPTAYLVVEPNDDPMDAIRRYCELMDDWATAVLASKTLGEVFPVAVAPTMENALQLQKRLSFLREHLHL